MTGSDRTWSELGERLEALALKLKLHMEQAGTGEVPQALSTLRAAVGEAFEAAGNAVRDDAVRADVRECGRLLSDAVSTTFSRVSGEVRELRDRQS